MHACNFVIVYTDFLIGRVQCEKHCAVYIAFSPLIYTFFAWIIFATSTDEWWPYWFLDTSSSSNAFWYVMLFAMHCGFWWIALKIEKFR